MRRNFDLSTGLVAAGAAAVLVSLFLSWYAPDLSAWDAFEIVDWALAGLAAAALVVLAGESPAQPPASNRLASIAGLAALLVASQIVDPPPVAGDAARETGIWIALAGSVAMLAGAALRLMRISVTIDVAERERRRRTAAVDARTSGRSERGNAPESGAGLWDGPAAEARAEPVTPPPVQDPDRTQPLPRTERPDEVG